MLTPLALLLFQDFVRVHDDVVRPALGVNTHVAPAPTQVLHVYPPTCSAGAAGRRGEVVPGGGTLDPVAFVNPATVFGGSAGASTAFFAQVVGATRNQGIFTHDGATLRAIALGSGALGGGGSTGTAGDPSPLGGNFSGFFGGTVFAPAVNAHGDVLFLADVFGGSAPRGLFLHRAASGTIVSVAAVGDPSPLGGTFARIGPGSLSDSGEVVFLASEQGGTAGADVFAWDGSSVRTIAASGDSAPHGSPYQYLGSETFGFSDGSFIPAGPVPDLDAQGNIVFRAITLDGRRGIVHHDTAGNESWLVHDLQPAPGGGTFFDLQAASLSETGEIAFLADVRFGPSSFGVAWFAGQPGQLRRGVGGGDALDGGTVNGVAYSRNPMTPLDDAGNLVQWVSVRLPSGSSRETIVATSPDGAHTILARQSGPTPLGGTHGLFDAWPSLAPLDTPGRAAFGSSVAGVSGVTSAHFVTTACAAARALPRNGSGVNASCFTAQPPVLGASWQASVDARGHAGATLTVVLGRLLGHPGLATPYGELLLDPASPLVLRSVLAGGGLVLHPGSVPLDLALLGRSAALQGLILGGGTELCNAVDVVLGY